METPNYYEFLQISPNADHDTIHRVYRFLAARLHPDNPETGDAGKFHLLKQAYDVLFDPARRTQYDVSCAKEASQQGASFTSVDFMDQIYGELNRRLAVLALLYLRRRTNPGYPEVSLAEIEMRMGFPRDYMEFTMWYLQKKAYISRADNACYTLTAEGVDFVETQRESIPTLNKLLTSSAESSANNPTAANDAYIHPRKPINVPAGTAPPVDQHLNKGDRRLNQKDRRKK